MDKWDECWKRLDKLRKRQLKAADAVLGQNNLLASAHRIQVNRILSKIPSDIAQYVTDNFLFVSTCDSNQLMACTVPFETLQKKGKGIIWLNPIIWDINDEKGRAYYILHEVAHAHLRHKSCLNGISKETYKKQESEAKTKAEEWLKNA